MILKIMKYDVKVHNAVEITDQSKSGCKEKGHYLGGRRDLRGKIRSAEKSKRSRTSIPKDVAMRSKAAGLGHPRPNSMEAMRRELRRTFAEYFSRLIPTKSRNSLILNPS